jgi:hypothetical protein
LGDRELNAIVHVFREERSEAKVPDVKLKKKRLKT